MAIEPKVQPRNETETDPFTMKERIAVPGSESKESSPKAQTQPTDGDQMRLGRGTVKKMVIVSTGVILVRPGDVPQVRIYVSRSDALHDKRPEKGCDTKRDYLTDHEFKLVSDAFDHRELALKGGCRCESEQPRVARDLQLVGGGGTACAGQITVDANLYGGSATLAATAGCATRWCPTGTCGPKNSPAALGGGSYLVECECQPAATN